MSGISKFFFAIALLLSAAWTLGQSHSTSHSHHPGGLSLADDFE